MAGEVKIASLLDIRHHVTKFNFFISVIALEGHSQRKQVIHRLCNASEMDEFVDILDVGKTSNSHNLQHLEDYHHFCLMLIQPLSPDVLIRKDLKAGVAVAAAAAAAALASVVVAATAVSATDILSTKRIGPKSNLRLCRNWDIDLLAEGNSEKTDSELVTSSEVAAAADDPAVNTPEPIGRRYVCLSRMNEFKIYCYPELGRLNLKGRL
ncbi:hypothetical protein HPP92_018781 [Vanilla planifolia]|uniref:Uncharacterized protein n=1 Tax=Vanilla planifolia TaxID=51239 RepID=A0A835UPP9_VANPL|nr:hypothetical protein HPP92_018781 [Vanilla planifolia]